MKRAYELYDEKTRRATPVIDLTDEEARRLNEALLATGSSKYLIAKEDRKGFYSGLTRSELDRTGTCETDWY